MKHIYFWSFLLVTVFLAFTPRNSFGTQKNAISGQDTLSPVPISEQTLLQTNPDTLNQSLDSTTKPDISTDNTQNQEITPNQPANVIPTASTDTLHFLNDTVRRVPKLTRADLEKLIK